VVKRFLGSIIDVRSGEVALTLLMFFYYYLLLVTYYFLKPARDSLFLTKLGSEQLPIVFMLIAVIVVPVITVYSRASRNLKLNRLINITTVILIVNLLILRVLLEFTHPFVFYTFYIWVSIYGALSTAQFWLLANGVFDATQAKRLFVLFGLGGIIGAFTGGEVTGLIVEIFDVSTENLLFFCMAFLTVCIFLVNAVWTLKQKQDPDVAVKTKRSGAQPKESYAEILKTIKASRHLILIVGIIATTVAAASFIDFQFKSISAAAFDTKQGLTAFLGKFYGRVSLISLTFQLFLSYRFLRWFGVGGSILTLPVSFLFASIAVLVSPTLLSAVLLRGADGVFRYSIDKTGRELLFLPVPLDVKKRTKIFIDIFVDRWFRGFAGGVLLLLVTVLGMSVRNLSFVVIGLLVVWIWFVFMMRREYVNAFRLALERRELDLGELRTNISDAGTLDTLVNALGSDSERQVAYALDTLEGVQDTKILAAVRPLLWHGDADIRARAIRLVRTSGDAGFIAEMAALLDDPNPEIRRDAMWYMCNHAEDKMEALRQNLADDSVLTRAATLGAIAANGSALEQELITESCIEDMIATDGEHAEFARSVAAEALGAVAKPEFERYLRQLVSDTSPTVASAAVTAIGKTHNRAFLPELLELLGNNRTRLAAREALAMFGDRILGTLSDYVLDPSVDFKVRIQLTRVMSRVPTQQSVDTLIAMLDHLPPAMRFYAIKALNGLRSRHPDLQFSHDALNAALVEETEAYYQTLTIVMLNGHPNTPGGALLQKALDEKIQGNVERIFRLLGLKHSQKDIFGAYLGFIGNSKQLRASAVEFLDNVLSKDVKKYLFPIVDNITDDFKLRKGQELFGVVIESREQALAELITGDDPWLAACAMYSVAESCPDDLRAVIEERLRDPDAVVRETAKLVLQGDAT
jgi:ATP/ADP translocase/HEAT repeat protein